MKIEIIKTNAELQKIADQWNELLESSATHMPFLRHEYLTTWWSTLGGGEWEQGELFVLIGRDDDGDLRGIAPLFLTNNLDRENALMFLGSIEISDYLDVIARPEDLEPFLIALLEYLTGLEGGAWNVLDLYNLIEDSPTLPALKVAADHFGLSFSQEPLQPSPYVDLPGTWDDYLAGIQKKQRHEIRRKIRRAEGYFIPVRWYFIEDENNLDDAMDDFMNLMAYDPNKAAFLTEVMRLQMKKAVHTAFRAGWLQLAFLDIGDEKAAAYLNFDFDNKIWIYNSGINFEHSQLSPGWVLLGYLIQWAIDNGRKRIDFMRGDEDYKYRFGGINRFVQRVQIRR
jgi:CelD/BcsL family acetyltransferase involved in cellulose biosynthesis